MHIAHSALILTILATFSISGSGQPAGPAGTAAIAATPAGAPSAIVQPAMDSVQSAMAAVKVDKWKGKAVRDEANSYISSIQRDLQVTLPGLLKDADAAPASGSKMLPAFRNVDALYDVLLRVVEAARASAPSDQVAQLQAAQSSLDKARRAFGDRLQETAAAQERKLSQLQADAQAKAMMPPCPVTAATPTATPSQKPAVKKKHKPATTQPASPAGTSQSNTTPKTPN